MMKFFRKHNKKLLAVFMTALMIVFLGGGALNTMLQPSGDRVVAMSDLGSISLADQRIAEDVTSILRRMGRNWQRPLPGAAQPLETVDWILLAREAQKLGLGSDPSAMRTSVADQTSVDEMARRLRRKPDQILHAMAEYASVVQAALAVAGSAAPSEAEILAAARDAFETVRVNAVLLPGEAFVDQEADFTEDQVEDQYSTYREREPGSGINFGYYVPPRVKVQYARIDRDAIAEQVGVIDLERKARIFFDERRERDSAFRKPPEATAVDAAASDEEALEGPPEEKSPYLAWEEAEDIAIGIVRKLEADSAASRIADWLIQRAGDPWLDIERQSDRYKEAPESVAGLDYYDALLAKIPRTISFSSAVSIGVTEFFSQEEAEDDPTIGRASFRSERGGVLDNLRTIPFRSKVVVPDLQDMKGANPSDYLATFQTSRYPLTDPDGNVYVFRIIDTREGHIPESVDEVRERVVADLHLLQGFESAKARAESLRSCEEAMSLKETFESDEELITLKDTVEGLGSGYFEPPPFTRASRYEAARGRGVQGYGTGSKYIGGGVGFVPNEVVDQCFALEETEETAVIELADRATVMVVEWVERQRVSDDEFPALREGFAAELARARTQTVIADWLDPDKIRARNGFKVKTN